MHIWYNFKPGKYKKFEPIMGGKASKSFELTNSYLMMLKL